MTRWANFLISAVRYSTDRKYITEMMQHEDMDGSVGEGTVVDRAAVATEVKKGKKYMTIYNAGDNWKKGSQIRSFIVEGEYFIRTDDNKVTRDNLGLLPEF